jgi:colicin import membrane protein
MRKLCDENSATRALILGRLNITEQSIATFKQSTESLQEVTKREEQVIGEDSKAPGTEIPTVPIRPTKKPKSQKPVKAVPDPSGFFTIDPNPTPIEQLYKEKIGKTKPTASFKAKESPKRRIEADHPPRPEAGSAEEPTRKKTKKNHERKAPPRPTVEDEQANGVQEPGGDDDDFVKAVEARTKAKEEKKKAKANKKRKRQSEDSTEGAGGTKKKKLKGKHEAKSEGGASPALAQGQKQKDKRPFAQADLGQDDENGKTGGKKKKQRKGKNSKA